MCSKTYCFRFVLQNTTETGEIHLLYIYAREGTVDDNRGVGNEGDGETKGAFTGKKRKKGERRGGTDGVAGRGKAIMWREKMLKEERNDGRKERETASTATLLFMLYSIVNGATLSVIFMVYTLTSLTCSSCC